MWDGEGMIPPNIKKEIQLVAPLSKIAFYQLVFVTYTYTTKSNLMPESEV